MNPIVAFGVGLALGGYLGYAAAKKTSGGIEPENDMEHDVERAQDICAEEKVDKPDYRTVLARKRPILRECLNEYDTVDPEKEITYETNRTTRPYVISPTDFDDPEYDAYSKITLTWYSDKVLASDDDIIDIPGSIILVGQDFHKHFGQYEDDCVYVRNERFKADYEILAVTESYAEVLQRKPYLKGAYDDDGNDQ